MNREPSTTGLPKLLTSAPLCGAKNRQGTPCRAPAMRGKKRCRLHGGKSPGAPEGAQNGAYRHGAYTQEVLAMEAYVRALARRAMNDGSF